MGTSYFISILYIYYKFILSYYAYLGTALTFKVVLCLTPHVLLCRCLYRKMFVEVLLQWPPSQLIQTPITKQLQYWSLPNSLCISIILQRSKLLKRNSWNLPNSPWIHGKQLHVDLNPPSNSQVLGGWLVASHRGLQCEVVAPENGCQAPRKK